jgi:uncharacterized protein DUF1549/uncharacterized protein DUF1553
MTRLYFAAGAEIPRAEEPEFRRAGWSSFILVLWFFGSSVFGAEPSADHRPLHARIDALVGSAAIGSFAPVCSDSDFVRRIYLDLTGVIPTTEQARTFLEDRQSGKRERLIDELVASPAFARHMTITFDAMLMQRLPEKVIKQPEWEAYLYNSLAGDKPLDRLFGELLSADGADAALRPAARFTLDRDAEPNLVTRDISRLVFGTDLQCCQCHDHPLIDDYYQADYYGLFSFVQRTSLFTDPKSKLVSLTEKAEGEASFKSVFTGAATDKATARLPKGPLLFHEPVFPAGGGYVTAPTKEVRGVPKFSRRAALAEILPTSREFARNLANRLWAMLLGRGLVHPLEFHSAGNPPSNPRLLTLLADELASGGFQLRPFVRELVLTRAYQRSCEPPSRATVNFADVAARLEQLAREKVALQQTIGPLQESLAVAKSAFKKAREEDAAVAAELPKLEKALADARVAFEKIAAERRAAEESADRVAQESKNITDAATKLAAAAAALPGDTTLAAAARDITSQSAKVREIAEALTRSLQQTPTGQADAAQQLAHAEAALAAVVDKRPTVSSLRKLERAQLAGEHELADAKYCMAACDAQMALAKSLVDFPALAIAEPAKAAAAWPSIVDKWTIAGQVAALRPLTAEQLAASAMQATGMLGPQLAAAAAKVEKSPPAVLKNASDADKPRIRTNLTQLELLSQLRPTCAEFIRQYGGLPGEEFQATVNQALFVANGTTIDGWLKPTGENLTARLVSMRQKADLTRPEETGKIIDELYLSVLSRPASDAEQRLAAKYLDQSDDKAAAFRELAWALLSSTEFRFNH